MSSLGACGGSGSSDALSPDAYGQKVHRVVLPLFASLKAVGAAKSPTGLRHALRTSERSVQSGIDILEGVDPPSVASDANDELLGALNDYEATLKTTERTLAGGSPNEVQAQIAAYETGSRAFGSELVDVSQKLGDAGIHVGPAGAIETGG